MAIAIAAASASVKLADVKARLNKTTADDDKELLSIIASAVAAYERLIGPISGTVTEVHDGGGTSIVLGNANVDSITAAAYTDGTDIDLEDLDLDSSTGILHWKTDTAGLFTYGTRNVTVTYTVGALPRDHYEAIVADVAGYFQNTQLGPAGLPGEGYEQAQVSTPLTLFPRIKALAPARIA